MNKELTIHLMLGLDSPPTSIPTVSTTIPVTPPSSPTSQSASSSLVPFLPAVSSIPPYVPASSNTKQPPTNSISISSATSSGTTKAKSGVAVLIVIVAVAAGTAIIVTVFYFLWRCRRGVQQSRVEVFIGTRTERPATQFAVVPFRVSDAKTSVPPTPISKVSVFLSIYINGLLMGGVTRTVNFAHLRIQNSVCRPENFDHVNPFWGLQAEGSYAWKTFMTRSLYIIHCKMQSDVTIHQHPRQGIRVNAS